MKDSVGSTGMIAVAKENRKWNRAVGFSAVAVTAVIACSLVARYYYRYANYSRKPLFFNTYSQGPDGIGPWRWQQLPFPLFGCGGRIILVDYRANMLVMIVPPPGEADGFYVESAIEDRMKVQINKKMVEIRLQPNMLEEVDDGGVRPVRVLQPEEAERIFNDLSAKKKSTSDEEMTREISRIKTGESL